jgi:hypothetical protein
MTAYDCHTRRAFAERQGVVVQVGRHRDAVPDPADDNIHAAVDEGTIRLGLLSCGQRSPGPARDRGIPAFSTAKLPGGGRPVRRRGAAGPAASAEMGGDFASGAERSKKSPYIRLMLSSGRGVPVRTARSALAKPGRMVSPPRLSGVRRGASDSRPTGRSSAGAGRRSAA